VNQQFFEKGMAILGTKTIVKDIQEIGIDGESLEVWIETDHKLSSSITSMHHLNGKGEHHDILFGLNAKKRVNFGVWVSVPIQQKYCEELEAKGLIYRQNDEKDHVFWMSKS
jgi:hypothetical protein